MMSDNEMRAVAWLRKNGFRFNGDIEPKDDSELPLYTRPALTDEQVREIAGGWCIAWYDADDGELTVRAAIEAAIREAIGRGGK